LKNATRVSPGDHVRGSPLARITLIGYGDFASPACAQTYRTVKQIQAKMGSRLREMRDHVHLARVRAGRSRGVRSGVVAAPTFFINLARHESAFGLSTQLPAVQAAAGE